MGRMVALVPTAETLSPSALRAPAQRYSHDSAAASRCNVHPLKALHRTTPNSRVPLGSCSRDPIGYAGGISLFRYTGSNPINAVDPSGNWYVGTGIGVGGFIAGGIYFGIGIGVSCEERVLFVKAPKRCPYFTVCTNCAISVYIAGYGVGAAAGGYIPVIVNPVPWAVPTDGPSCSMGYEVLWAEPGVVMFPLAPNHSIELDPLSGEIEWDIGKFGPGAGILLAAKVSFNCTGCSAHVWEVRKRWSKVANCIGSSLTSIRNFLNGSGPEPDGYEVIYDERDRMTIPKAIGVTRSDRARHWTLPHSAITPSARRHCESPSVW